MTRLVGGSFTLQGRRALSYAVPLQRGCLDEGRQLPDLSRLRVQLPDDLVVEDSAWICVIPGEGQWRGHGDGEFQITEETIDTLIANFDKRGTPLPLDYNHALVDEAVRASGQPIPSSGHAYKLQKRYGDNGAQLWAFVEFSARAAEMIRGREVQTNSPVLMWDALDFESGEEQGPTLHSIAMTDDPFLQGQQPARLSYRPRGKKMDKITATQVRAALQTLTTKAEDSAASLGARAALQRVLESVVAEDSQLELQDRVWSELKSASERDVVRGVLTEAGVITAASALESDDEDKPAVMESDDMPEQDDVAAEGEPEEEMVAAEEGEDMPSPEGLINTIAEGAGTSYENALAWLMTKTDTLIEEMNAAADRQQDPGGGSAMSNNTSNAELRKLRLDNSQMQKRLEKLEADRQAQVRAAEQAEKARVSALKARAAEQAQWLIDEGFMGDKVKDDLVKELQEAKDDADLDRRVSLFSQRKVIPESQAAEPKRGEDGKLILSKADLDDNELHRFSMLMKLDAFRRYGKAAETKVLERIAARRSN